MTGTLLLSTESELAEVVPLWAELALEVGAALPAQPLWAMPWWRHLGRGTLHVRAAFEGDELVALAPLHERRVAGGSLLRFLGFGLGAVSELLVRPGHDRAACAVWAAILGGRARRLQLAEYRLAGDSLAALRQVAPGRTRVRRSNRCPILHVTGTLERFLASRPKRLRATLRKAAERLALEGRGHRIELVRTPAELEARLPDVRAVYDAAERARPRQHLLAGAAEPFLRSLLADAAHAGRLRLFVGYVDGAPASFDAAFTSGDRLEVWLGRFDPAFAAYAAGHLSFRGILEHAYEAGVQVIDLGLGDDRYKRQWCDDGYDTAAVDAGSSRAALLMGDAALGGARLARLAAARVRGLVY